MGEGRERAHTDRGREAGGQEAFRDLPALG